MTTMLSTTIGGGQITDASISGAHIIDAVITPIKLNAVNFPNDGDLVNL